MRKKYRFLSGNDDAAFCQKVSDALDDGYVLYGSPTLTAEGGRVIVGQAVILPSVVQKNDLSDGKEK
ncbi:DUF1737 domain-containing protein [Alphaproteobacteria bacterium]|nr:DUF1737 domain-containing protein [Alphaproteobacteria bacterium]